MKKKLQTLRLNTLGQLCLWQCFLRMSFLTDVIFCNMSHPCVRILFEDKIVIRTIVVSISNYHYRFILTFEGGGLGTLSIASNASHLRWHPLKQRCPVYSPIAKVQLQISKEFSWRLYLHPQSKGASVSRAEALQSIHTGNLNHLQLVTRRAQ